QAGALYEYTHEKWDTTDRFHPIFLGYYPDPTQSNAMFVFGDYGKDSVGQFVFPRDNDGALIGSLLVRPKSSTLPPIVVAPPPTPPAKPSLNVGIDITPFVSNNLLTIGNPTITVAILSTSKFDATTAVDVKSLRFGN